MNIAFLKTKRIIWLLVLWQLISVLLMGLGVWPASVAWFNVILIAMFILFADPHDAVVLLIASIPFYVVLPNRFSDGFSAWRLLFAWSFLVWFVKTLFQQGAAWLKPASLRSRFLPWDKYLGLFAILALVSSLFARFRVQSLKQILFLVNVYLLYLVIINTTTTRERVVELIKTAAASAAIIVGLGYVQFIATFFASSYYFWQYWAIMVSKLYYGLGLANVLAYSNSWFSYENHHQTLRMFSIMPDSHSFAVICMFGIGFLLPLLYIYIRPKREPRVSLTQHTGALLKSRNYYAWYAIRFTGLAVILSGTRGVWVGMIVPMALSAWMWWKKVSAPMMKKIFISEILIVLFFLLTPFINTGLNFIRFKGYEENFLDRARSIYDLSEESNAGRILIWKNSLVYAIHHPLGTGYGNFVVSVVTDIQPGAKFSEVASQKNLRYNLPQKFVTAHSLYLNILVELGILGVIIFFLIWWKYFSAVWRFLKKHAGEYNVHTMFVAASSFTMIWLLAYGVFDTTLFNDKVLMFFFINLAITGLILRRYDSFGEEPAQGPAGKV